MVEVITPVTQAISSFSFNDAALGFANIPMFAGISTDSTGESFIISNSSFYSDPIVKKATYENDISSPTQLLDLDFDLGFGLPRIVNGNIVVNVILGMGDAHGPDIGNRNVTLDGSVTIFSVTGGVETSLGVVEMDEVSGIVGNAGRFAHMYNIIIPIDNQAFAEGDKLRVNIKGVFSDDTIYKGVAGIGCDPQNRNELFNGAQTPQLNTPCIPDDKDTNLHIQVPFKIDL